MTTVNKQQSKFSRDEKLYYSNSIPPCKIVIISVRVTLWHMGHKKMKDISKNKENYQFKVGCVSFSNLETEKEIQGTSVKMFVLTILH